MNIGNKNIYDPIKVDDDYFAYHESEQEDFYAKLKTLPESIVNNLFSMDTPEVLEKISSSCQLNTKQSEELSRLVRKVLVAEIYLGNIVKEIQTRLAVAESVAKELASQLLSQLFAPAVEDIKKIHVERFGRKENPIQPTTTQDNINPGNVVNLREKQ